ncbi:Hypothetical protein [Mycobacterium tuberculosis H37Rv] [Mycobacterium shimoidei]|uniref:Uncharacterized protein n=2 Tax=Mycobacterium shimoidei TaxID=29313 RepID=A0A375YTF1_MYCSH|nr:Hypothetical protein [Mycobacterium tuberculosis H37Rv] [Mycobacterium shimoidei]
MELRLDDRYVNVAALYLPEMSATAALRAAYEVPTDVPLLVVGPRVHGSSADIMRTRGIWYVDEAGNAYLRDHALLIDVRGRRGSASTSLSQPHKSGPTNLFTPKRARVVFVLLCEPALTDAPFREIAERSGVSLGMAKETIDTLETVGFVEKLGRHRRLIRRGELLDLWASAYPSGLGRTNVLVVAHGDIQHWVAPGGVDVAISGEQALSRLGLIRNPETLVLYLDSRGERGPLRELMLINRWHSDPDGSITVREMFWRNLRPSNDIDTAPLILVYADLLASNEPRQIEIAREIRRSDERLVKL